MINGQNKKESTIDSKNNIKTWKPAVQWKCTRRIHHQKVNLLSGHTERNKNLAFVWEIKNTLEKFKLMQHPYTNLCRQLKVCL